jgi:hypothetical protein
LIENFNENYKNNNYPSSISGEKQSLNTNQILNFKNNSLNEASLNFENRNFSQKMAFSGKQSFFNKKDDSDYRSFQ